MKEALRQLIEEGDTYNYRNNSVTHSYGSFSKASDDLLAWISRVEDFIEIYYGMDSSPYKLFHSANRNNLSGGYQTTFEKELTKIKGALKACEKIEPKPKKKKVENNQILALLKNPFFYVTCAVLVGAAFTFGLSFGSSKFDKEKNDYYILTKQQEKIIEEYKNKIVLKDSLINILNTRDISSKDKE